MRGATPNSRIRVPRPRPRACTPRKLSSGAFGYCGPPNHQRASYSRKPVALTKGVISKSYVLAARSVRGVFIGRPEIAVSGRERPGRVISLKGEQAKGQPSAVRAQGE